MGHGPDLVLVILCRTSFGFWKHIKSYFKNHMGKEISFIGQTYRSGYHHLCVEHYTCNSVMASITTPKHIKRQLGFQHIVNCSDLKLWLKYVIINSVRSKIGNWNISGHITPFLVVCSTALTSLYYILNNVHFCWLL